MGLKQITNPNLVYGYSDDGQSFPQWSEPMKNTGAVAIAKGDAVAFKYTATGTLLECEAWDTDASGQSASNGAGVAVQDIAIGSSGLVCVGGYCRAQVAGNTAAEGNQALGSTVAGVLTPTAADASTVVGTSIGVFLGAKDASNLAPLWLR